MRTDRLVGRRLGEFVIRDRIGEGGFGVVYRAFQPGLDRDAVIKVLHAQLQATPASTERFLREAKLASKLDHPYAAHVYAFGAQPDGELWIAMELVRGTSLDEILAIQGPLPLERFVPLLERICEVVHTAHDQGIVHRDLKPGNVMVLSRAGRLLPKLLDFGIAKAMHATGPAIDDTHPALDATKGATLDPGRTATDDDRPPSRLHLTQRGAVMGSPHYMAPEQWRDAGKVDARTDLYALGVLAYEAITGKPPFGGTSLYEIAQAHASQPPPPLGSGLPAALDAVFAKVLAKEPAERFTSAIEFAESFRKAAGISVDTRALPGIANTVRDAALATAPQPIAEAVAMVAAARNPHQARDAYWQLVRTIVRYLGLVCLACRSRVAGGDTAAIGDAMRTLYRRSLTDREWIDVARRLTAIWVDRRDAYPLPELVDLFHDATGGPAAPGAVLDRLIALRESAEPGATDEAATSLVERVADEVTALLESLAFLGDYPLVVPLGPGLAERWTGTRRAQRATIAVRGTGLAAGEPALLDSESAPVLSLAPLFQVAAPTPGAPLELFVFDGRGRHGAKLVALPSGFEHHDDSLWDWFRAQLSGSLDEGEARTAAERPPYLGLSAFSAGDVGMFFGRERQVDAFLNRLKVQPMLVVVGRSGAGKSSFVQAGVIPALPDGWRAVTVRPGSAPIAALTARLQHAGFAVGELEQPLGGSLGALLRADAAARGPIVLVIDQLEELFTLCADAGERREYADAVAGAARTAEDLVRVVFTLRDDFLVRAEQLAALRNRLGQALQLLTVPAPDDLLRILIEPARRAGYEFEDRELPAEMVKEVADQPGALALISFTGARLWELRDRHFKQLTRAAYRTLGGVGGALARHAELTLEGMLPEEQRLTREAFRHLVTTQNTRAVLDRVELRQLLGGSEHADGVVEKLVAARLLVASENERGGETIEIVHEALLTAWPRLVEWRREDVEGARLREQLRAAARQWDERDRNDGLLWRGDALADYTRWRARHSGALTDVEQAFADASQGAAVRGRRVRRGLLVAAFAVLAAGVVVLLKINAGKETQRKLAAQAQTRAEASQRLVLEEQGRQLFLAGDPIRALIYLHAAREAGADDPALSYLTGRAAAILAKQERAFIGHTGLVYDAMFSRDGGRLLTRSTDGTARIWDVATGGAIATLTAHTGFVLSIDLAPDGAQLVTGGEDHTARLWDASTGRLLRTLEGAQDRVYVTEFSRDGSRVLTAGGDGVIRIWNAATGEPIAALADRIYDLTDATLAADARAVYSVAYDHEVARWDLGSRTRTVLDPADAEGARCPRCRVELSPDGTIVVAASAVGTVGIWRAADGQRLRTLDLRADQDPEALVFDAGTRLAIAVGSEIQVWDVGSGQRVATMRGHGGKVLRVAFSHDGSRLASSSDDGTVRVWDAATSEQVGLIPTVAGARTVAFAPDDSALAISAGSHAELWDPRPDVMVAAYALGQPATSVSFGPATSAGGPAIIACGSDGGAKIWRAGTAVAIQHGAGACNAAAFSPDGTVVATAGDDGAIRIWDAAAAQLRATLTVGGGGRVGAVAFSPDGKRVLTGHEDHRARIWNLATAAPERTLDGHDGEVTAVAWSPTGSYVATCGEDARARLIEVATNAATDLPLNGFCLSIAFSPDGARVVAAGRNTARIWTVANTKQWIDLEGRRQDDLAVFASNELVLTRTGPAAKIWDAETGRLLDSWAHNDAIVGGADRGVDRGVDGLVASASGTQVFVFRLPAPIDAEHERATVDALPLVLRGSFVVAREGIR